MYFIDTIIFTLLASGDSLIQRNDSITRAIISDVANGQGLERMGDVLKQLLSWAITMGGRVLAAILVFIIGRFIIKMVNKLFSRLLTNKKVDPGVISFLRSLINALLMMLLFIAVVNKLGIETTSFAALLASFGVAIGMAMSGNLSNLVGGMLILMFKPYRVGDLIEVNGIMGRVQSIEIFHTILRTAAGVNIYFSNGEMSSNMIKNYSKETHLRLDLKVSVEYGQDLKLVEQTLRTMIDEDNRILKTPAPSIVVDELADSSVNLSMRVWVMNDDYWDVKYDLTRLTYERFNEASISFPFPQITVHQA